MFDEKEMITITIKYIVTVSYLTICSVHTYIVYLDFFTIGFTADDKDLRSRSWHKI